VALREARKMSMAIAMGDANAIRAERAGWESVMAMMNSRQADIYNFSLIQLNRFENLNAQVDRALLYLRIARAWRDGKEPAPVVAQGSQQLERVDLERFGVFTEHDYEENGAPRQGELRPLLDAIGKFQSHGEVPTTPGEIEAVIKAAGPGDWEKYVVRVSARPVYFIWAPRRVMAREFNWRLGGREITDETADVLEIFAVANNGPIVGEWMRKILKEKRYSNSKEDREPKWQGRSEQLLL
jgi:hypothetical protein